MHYLLNHMIDFDQTCIDALLGGGGRVDCQMSNFDQNRVFVRYLFN